MVATANKNEVQDYFALEGDQDAGAPELIPSARKGGPADNLCLFQMGEDEVELQHGGDESKNPGHTYVSFIAEVLAPEEWEDSRVRGMIYFPPTPEDTDDAKAMKKFSEQMRRTIGQVDGILGTGTVSSLEGDLESRLEEIINLLDGVSFVGEVSTEKAKGGYRAKNRINRFLHSDTWNEAGE